ncbi:MAG TPA: hypothetical protein RMH99_31195 [Sandaracinaceae bacterium LLY-WYZ-13_1]|nr:hypothetical protein [Sandaracinaceae bacterium LLY-WYZ-13_1]
MSARSTWRRLDPSRAEHLGEARLELHWAAQIASAAGTTWRDAADDFSHTALRWAPSHDALLGEPVGHALRAGLRPHDLSLLVVGPGDAVLESRPLAGRTLAQGLRWLSDALSRHSGGALDGPLTRPAHDLPAHPVGDGARFTGGVDGGSTALGDWLADAHALLTPLARTLDHASPVRCWPHHFDIATLVSLGGDRSVGLGLSVGDDETPAPYFYATPWPPPRDATTALPGLPAGGAWHTDGWFGAQLVGSALPAEASPQRSQAEIFLDAAFAACQTLLPSREG